VREVLRYEPLEDRSRFSIDREAEAFIELSALGAKKEMRMRTLAAAGLSAALMLTACNQSQPQSLPQNQAQQPHSTIGPEQQQLHQLDALNLAIALKRAIYDSGFSCRQIAKAGYVGPYKNLDEWTAHCTDGRDWAIFAGPDGSAQVRDCADVARFGLPKCEIHETPKGSVNGSS
jgi:hypothetical protein